MERRYNIVDGDDIKIGNSLMQAGRKRLVSRPSEYVRFARTRLLTRAALIRAATVRERSAQRTELPGHDTSP